MSFRCLWLGCQGGFQFHKGDLVWEVKNYALCFVQIGSDRACCLCSPWGTTFSPAYLAGSDLSRSLVCVPAVSVSGKGTVTAQNRAKWCLGLDRMRAWFGGPARKPPVVRLGFCPSATEALGTGRLETLSQPACVLLPSLHVLFSLQVLGDCPERWQTCSQMRGLASLWAILPGGPQGQAQTLLVGQEADARLWPGRGDTFLIFMLWPFIQKEGFRFLQPEAEDSLWWGFVTHMA